MERQGNYVYVSLLLLGTIVSWTVVYRLCIVVFRVDAASQTGDTHLWSVMWPLVSVG